MITDEQKVRIKFENKKIDNNISHVKYKVVVFSGKGGVGKTTVSVNLAYGLQTHGNEIGILDVDITRPNFPKMIGIKGDVHTNDGKIIPQLSRGVKVISMANMLSFDEAVVWRGPMRSKMINEFLGKADMSVEIYRIVKKIENIFEN
jgi:Mrp family chromosome partitioning ATPase